MAATRSTSKISPKWVRHTRRYFLKFLRATRFPLLERHGSRGQTFVYPEWLIMLIGVLAVKCKEPTYLGIHRMTRRFWHELCGRSGCSRSHGVLVKSPRYIVLGKIPSATEFANAP